MRRLCCAVLLATAANAADEGHTDLRLLVGGYPGYDEVSYGDGPTYTLDDHRAVAIQFEAVRSFEDERTPFYPWLLSGVVLRFSDAADERGSDHTVVATTWELGGGLGIWISREARLELGVVGAAGQVTVNDERQDALTFNTDSWYASIEVRMGLWYRIDQVHVGVVAGAAFHGVSASFGTEADPDIVTSTYSGGGPFVLIGFGIELD